MQCVWNIVAVHCTVYVRTLLYTCTYRAVHCAVLECTALQCTVYARYITALCWILCNTVPMCDAVMYGTVHAVFGTVPCTSITTLT